MLPINDKINTKEKEEPIPYGLSLESIQWQKELKEERETDSLKIKTWLKSMANGT